MKDVRISHVIRYINAMVGKDKKTMQDSYPAEMSESQKNYIIKHLEHIQEEKQNDTTTRDNRCIENHL